MKLAKRIYISQLSSNGQGEKPAGCLRGIFFFAKKDESPLPLIHDAGTTGQGRLVTILCILDTLHPVSVVYSCGAGRRCTVGSFKFPIFVFQSKNRIRKKSVGRVVSVGVCIRHMPQEQFRAKNILFRHFITPICKILRGGDATVKLFMDIALFIWCWCIVFRIKFTRKLQSHFGLLSAVFW